MRRLPTFLFGVVAGGLLIWTAMNYHLIRSQQGFHLVKKTAAGLGDFYLDARTFGPRDWVGHPEAAQAVLRSDNKPLIDELMGNAVDNALNKFLPPAPPESGR